MAQLVVIDDDDAIRGWLAAVLRAARHQVRVFASAEAALPHLTQSPPDLLLSDIRLPGQSGLDGIVHRDVKPANIMIRSASSFAVTDFGAAKRTRVDTSLTMDGRIIGTPSYVSPE